MCLSRSQHGPPCSRHTPGSPSHPLHPLPPPPSPANHFILTTAPPLTSLAGSLYAPVVSALAVLPQPGLSLLGQVSRGTYTGRPYRLWCFPDPQPTSRPVLALVHTQSHTGARPDSTPPCAHHKSVSQIWHKVQSLLTSSADSARLFTPRIVRARVQRIYALKALECSGQRLACSRLVRGFRCAWPRLPGLDEFHGQMGFSSGPE